MKKLVLLITLIVTYVMAKPYIQLSFSNSGGFSDVANGYVLSSVTDSERFYIYFSEAFKVIFKEVKFQDFFTSEDLLSGTFKESDYKLVMNVKNFSLKSYKKKKYYLKDNENGNYILVNGNYLRVYVGEWYRYDYEKDRYVLDKKNGRYVKSTDGKYYYYYGDFYRRMPVEETWVKIDIDADYKLYSGTKKIISGTFKKEVEKRLIYYTYDELNKKIIKHFENEKLWVSELAEEFSKKVLNDLKREFVIKANIQSFKDVVVVIDKGRGEGIKPGMVFEGNGNLFMVREVTQDTSEAEVIKYSNVPLKNTKYLTEDQDFRSPLYLHLGFGYSNINGVYLLVGLQSIDLHWKEKSYGGVFVSYEPINGKTNYGVDFRVRLYKNFYMGISSTLDHSLLYGGISVLKFNPYVGVSNEGIVVGGDVAW